MFPSPQSWFGLLSTYWAKSNSRGSQSYQTAIPGVRLVNGIGILIAKLLKNVVDTLIVLGGDEIADDSL